MEVAVQMPKEECGIFRKSITFYLLKIEDVPTEYVKKGRKVEMATNGTRNPVERVYRKNSLGEKMEKDFREVKRKDSSVSRLIKSVWGWVTLPQIKCTIPANASRTSRLEASFFLPNKIKIKKCYRQTILREKKYKVPLFSMCFSYSTFLFSFFRITRACTISAS